MNEPTERELISQLAVHKTKDEPVEEDASSNVPHHETVHLRGGPEPGFCGNSVVTGSKNGAPRKPRVYGAMPDHRK